MLQYTHDTVTDLVGKSSLHTANQYEKCHHYNLDGYRDALFINVAIPDHADIHAQSKRDALFTKVSMPHLSMLKALGNGFPCSTGSDRGF